MTLEELASELRGYIAQAKAEDGEGWSGSEIHLAAGDLELLLDEVDPPPARAGWWWDAQEWEFTSADISLVTENIEIGQVLELGRAAKLPNVWAAHVMVGGADDDDDDSEIRIFATRAEAEAAVAAGETPPS